MEKKLYKEHIVHCTDTFPDQYRESAIVIVTVIVLRCLCLQFSAMLFIAFQVHFNCSAETSAFPDL